MDETPFTTEPEGPDDPLHNLSELSKEFQSFEDKTNEIYAKIADEIRRLHRQGIRPTRIQGAANISRSTYYRMVSGEE